MPETLRLFIASHLSGPPVAPLSHLTQSLDAQLAAEPHAPALRWTSPEHWHLTWQFLGDTPVTHVPLLQSALQSALIGQSALPAQWRELCWWPSRHRPQILVALLESTPALQAMAERVAQSRSQASIQTTRQASASALHPPQGASSPTANRTSRKAGKKRGAHQAFKPHITLARLKDRAFRGPVPALPEIPAEMPDWRIDSVTLFKSELHSAGAIHTPIITVPLPPPPVE